MQVAWAHPVKSVAPLADTAGPFPCQTKSVLVQPEMERRRSPLVSIPPLGRGFSRHRYDHQTIPQHGCVRAEPASVSPGKIIVAPPRPSVSTSGYAVIQALYGGRRAMHTTTSWLLVSISFLGLIAPPQNAYLGRQLSL